MYAIVEIAGQQFKVQKDQRVFVHRLEGKEGDKVEFDNVLLIDNNGKVSVGAPAINGALVKATILEHLKGDKVIVFKKKRRKGYKKKNGHRQYLSAIEINDIIASGAKKSAKPAAKKEEKPKAETAKKEAPKAKEKKETKKAAPKKAEAKKETKAKPAAKKAADKKEEKPKAKASSSTKKKAEPKAEKKGDNKKEQKDEK